jgi:hypothetical protein
MTDFPEFGRRERSGWSAAAVEQEFAAEGGWRVPVFAALVTART